MSSRINTHKSSDVATNHKGRDFRLLQNAHQGPLQFPSYAPRSSRAFTGCVTAFEKPPTALIVDAEALQRPPYAVLSHRWGTQEVTLQQFQNSRAYENAATQISNLDGYQKIRQFCHLAANASFDFGWVDSVCIDKTSSAELSEAINEFFEALSNSQWWKRGWTLQELLAPARVVFFSTAEAKYGKAAKSR